MVFYPLETVSFLQNLNNEPIEEWVDRGKGKRRGRRASYDKGREGRGRNPPFRFF